MEREAIATLLQPYEDKVSFGFRDFWGAEYVWIECPAGSPNGLQTPTSQLDTKRLTEWIKKFVDQKLSYAWDIKDVKDIPVTEDWLGQPEPIAQDELSPVELPNDDLVNTTVEE